MVYDQTINRRTSMELSVGGPSGFSIHDNLPQGAISELDLGGEPRYSVFTDDGHGNGDYVCGASELGWARAVAHALDYTAEAGQIEAGWWTK